MTIANGTFEVKLNPQTPSKETQDSNIGRMSITKHYSGDLEASSLGEMLSVLTGIEGSAGYVAIERVNGSLNGRKGNFALQHNGIMTRGSPQLTIKVVPDSGTDQLTGLSGKMAIDISEGNHSYQFKYLFSE